MNYSILFCKKKEVILSIWIQLKENFYFPDEFSYALLNINESK